MLELTKLQKTFIIIIVCLTIILLILIGCLIFLRIRTDVRLTKCKVRHPVPTPRQLDSRPHKYQDILHDTTTTMDAEFEKTKKFIVSIHYKFDDGTDFTYCVGSVISKNYLMTSSLCMHLSLVQSSLYARAGSVYYDRGGTIHRFTSEVNIPDWRLNNTDYYTYRYMILVKVAPSFIIDNVAISTVRLPRQNTGRFLPNHRLYTAGWGTYISMKVKPMYEQLRPMVSQMYDSAIVCNNYLQKDELKALAIIENVLCAGDLKAASKDQCNIDSGAPLTHLGIIRGVSWSGMSCKNYPTIYSKISMYATWISDIISD